MNQKFPKSEKLKSKKRIELLFKAGQRVKAYPLLLAFKKEPTGCGLQAGVSVPKRNHKLAVTRNRLKRLMREAYRKNKNIIDTKGRPYSFMIIYTGRDVISYTEMEKAFNKLVHRFNEAVANK